MWFHDLPLPATTLHTYQEGGKCGDGIHHLYVHTRGAERLSSTSPINVVVTPADKITSINIGVGVTTREDPRAALTWMLRHPYAYPPPPPSTLPRPLLAGSNGPARMVARASGGARSSA